MAEHGLAMFKTSREITGRIESQKRFSGEYLDKHDVDDDGNAKKKPFVPSSLRAKQPINHSKKVRNDSRCAKAFAKITAVTEEARKVHEAYKNNMSAFAKQMGSLEIEARIEMLEHQFNVAVLEIAEGLVIIGETTTNAPPPKISTTELAHLALKDSFVENFGSSIWTNLPFVGSNEETKKKEYFKKYQEFHSVNWDRLETKRDDSDSPLIEWVSDEIDDIVPELTTKFWADTKEKDDLRKVDARLEERFAKKKIDAANDELQNAMEVDGEDVLANAVNRQLQRQQSQKTSRAKRNARKKSSGGPKDHGPNPTEDGDGRRKKSRSERRKQSRRRSERSDDEYSSSDEEEYRQRRRRPKRNDRPPKDRRQERADRRDRSRPSNRRRSVSWGRNRTRSPPRSRYSRDEGRDRRRNGATYHGSRNRGRNHCSKDEDNCPHDSRRGRRPGGSREGGRGSARNKRR